MKSNSRMNWLPMLIAIVLAMGLGNAATAAASAEAGSVKTEAWMFHDIVSVEFVQPFVKVPPPENVLIIDSRPKRAKYDKGHIPMAINIPDSQFEKMTDKLPQDKDTLLIFYCEGLK